MQELQKEEPLLNYPNLKSFSKQQSYGAVVASGYSPYERLKRAIRRREEHSKQVLNCGNSDLLQAIHRPTPKFDISGELRSSSEHATRTDTFMDQMYEVYWAVVRFWNAVVGGYIPLKDLARILEQYPPFSQLCQQSLMPCIYDQLPLNERVRLRDFFRSENNHKVKETGADICLIHALNNCTGVPFMIRIRDMLWLQTHYSG